MTTYHLPAVVPVTHRPRPPVPSRYAGPRDIDDARRYSPSTQVRLVSACGRGGAIRARGGIDQWSLAAIFPTKEQEVCPACQTLWDRAEETGALLAAYTWNGNQEWRGSACLTMVPPTHRSTRGYTRGGHMRDLRVTVFVRTEKPPKLVRK